MMSQFDSVKRPHYKPTPNLAHHGHAPVMDAEVVEDVPAVDALPHGPEAGGVDVAVALHARVAHVPAHPAHGLDALQLLAQTLQLLGGTCVVLVVFGLLDRLGAVLLSNGNGHVTLID